LEIGAGTGSHTRVLTEGGAYVVATDIATGALAVLVRGMDDVPPDRVTPCACDMEDLPFRDRSFDVVASAGSLSYGDPEAVDGEIVRVLRAGGCFVCVDSLNHNPIYRLNRWLHHRRGHRSASTVSRIPGMGRLGSLSRYFASVDVQYFGGFTWAMPVMMRVIGEARAATLSDVLDRWFRVRRSAFKFVLVARGRR
jgi:ubiquinone/menaquinone biosynthesis C-methylase UbiE